MARDDEFEQALAALSPATAFQGVAFVGDSGVGKSALARAVADRLESDGQPVRFVLGTQTGRDVPLGAFSRSVTVDAAHEPAAMLAGAHKSLAEEANLVLVVDDAQLLDPLSATLVYQLAADRTARLVVTIRSGEPVLDAVTALVKEELLAKVHVDPFTRDQTGELTRAALGGTVGPRLIDELQARSGGNLLLLRGLLRAGRENGVLAQTEDGWQLHGPLRGDRELLDLLEFRLRSLTPAELEVVEVLAAGELLDWQILREQCDTEALVSLERRGMIQLVVDGPEMVAELNHPVIGEAALRLAGLVRSRRLNGILAQMLQRHLQHGGQRIRTPDIRGQIRLAQFMMRSDLEPDLDVIVDAASSALALANRGYAVELARFAVEQGGGLPAALVLANALSWQGRGEEAEEVLAGVDPSGADGLSMVRWRCLRAANLFWGCGQLESAQRVIADTHDQVSCDAGTALVVALELAVAYFGGNPAPAIEAGPALCERDVLPLATAWAAVPTAHALAAAGRVDDTRRITELGVQAAAASLSGLKRFVIGAAEVIALTAAGALAAAEKVVAGYAAMAAGVPEADAMVAGMAGLVHLARGELPDACAVLQDSLDTLSGGFPPNWLLLVAVWAAQAEGERANAAGAAAALRRAEASFGPPTAVLLPELELARCWERVSANAISVGRAHALGAAQIAHRSGMWAVEMRALHAAVRLGDRAQGPRLAQLATMLGTPLAEAAAIQARGLARHDGDLLDAAADYFVGVGALACAADAAAQAAAMYARGGNVGKGLASSARAHWLASRCGARTPAVQAAAQPLPLTDREREVAMLASEGLSNREIADRLWISVRTVDGHVSHVYAKLGIRRRDELADRLAQAGARG